MELKELKERAEQLWKEQYREVLEMRETFGHHDEGTERAYAKLCHIEETISWITGDVICDYEYDKWMNEVREEV